MSEEEVNEIFKESDLDDQPNVDYREFIEYWESQQFNFIDLGV
jgi:Ca2+-binding EF-hand superfamily protein